MELNHLKYFFEVARHGSFTAAARAIRISQPSLSKCIRLLEESEGVRLFVRGKRGVALTSQGKRVFQSCQRVFHELDSLKAGLIENRDEVMGELSIGASDNLCNYVLPRILAAYGRQFPRVAIKLFSGTASQIQAELFSGSAELGLFYTKIKGGRELAAEPLRFVEFAIVHAPKKGGRPSDLAKTPYIGSRTSDYSRTYPALEMLHSIGLRPHSTIETNSQETQKKLALLGAGFTLVPLHVVASELKSGALVRARSPKTLGAWISLVRRRNRPESPAAERFVDALVKDLANPHA